MSVDFGALKVEADRAVVERQRLYMQARMALLPWVVEKASEVLPEMLLTAAKAGRCSVRLYIDLTKNQEELMELSSGAIQRWRSSELVRAHGLWERVTLHSLLSYTVFGAGEHQGSESREHVCQDVASELSEAIRERLGNPPINEVGVDVFHGDGEDTKKDGILVRVLF